MDPLSQIHDLLPEVIDVLPPGDLERVSQERSGTLFFVVQKNQHENSNRLEGWRLEESSKVSYLLIIYTPED